MSGPTFSPDGQWMWDGNTWIPAPPQSKVLPLSSINQQSISSLAALEGLDPSKLSNTARYFDHNQDGVLQKYELQQALTSMKNPSPRHELVTRPQLVSNYQPTITYSTQSTQKRKTFYATFSTIGLVLALMFTPFLTFEHDELTNTEEVEACEFLYTLFQSSTNDGELVESDDLECPMNGYTSSIYSIETVSNFEIEDLDEESSSETTDDTSNDDYAKENMFGIAMLMLIASPFVYLLFAVLSLLSVLANKTPILIGILQLTFVVLFTIISLSGSIGGDSFELTVHGNFAGIGIHLVGYASLGYLIPK